MQALVRVQGRVRARRLQLTHEKHHRTLEEQHPVTMFDTSGWDYRRQSSHKIKENDFRKYGTTMNKDKPLPYAFNHQVIHFFLQIKSFFFFILENKFC
jgi:hypothetical protein